MSNRAILLLSCSDKEGILSEVTTFIYNNGGNIISADQYTDNIDNMFFMRLEWSMEKFKISKKDLKSGAFEDIAKKFKMDYNIYFSDENLNIAIFVTAQDHCLLEALWRSQQGEFAGTIKCIISNHENLRTVASQFGLNYYHIPVEKGNKSKAEKEQNEILDHYDINLIVLAKYMQVLSNKFVEKYKNRIINIHHSFLPAFEGSKPYHRAYDRGVKLIGSTVHYVNGELDKGPIIDQNVIRVSHKDSVLNFIQKGKDLEKLLLVRGIKLHLEHRILVYKNKTILFE